MSTLPPIFYDPYRRRGSLATRIALGLCTSIVAIYSVGLWSIVYLSHANVAPSPIAAPTSSAAHFISFHSNQSTNIFQSKIPVFYDAGNDLSTISLQQHLNQISELIPNWLEVKKVDGTVTETDVQDEHKVEKIIGSTQIGIEPLLNEESGSSLNIAIANAEVRHRLSSQLTNLAVSHGWRGLTLEFEQEADEKQLQNRLEFMRQLRAQTSVHHLRLLLVQPVGVADGQQSLLSLADQVFLTVYDQHWSGSGPGPVAATSWVIESVKQRMRTADADKYIYVLANYGYDWSPGMPAVPLDFQGVMDQLRSKNIMPIYDVESGNEHASYLDTKGRQHQIWYTDALSLQAQLQAIHVATSHIGLWEVGAEDPGAWAIIGGGMASALTSFNFAYDLRYQGDGEISTVVAKPQSGIRQISLSKDGKITSAITVRLPSSLTVDRQGSQNSQQIALTFDDGPDPEFTPQILDILNQYGVSATFFIIGSSAARYPNLVKRAYQEGNEIGNHTYYHSNVAVISSLQLQLEVNATERTIESVTGHHSVLFRPPYAIDGEPKTANEVRPLALINQMGYQTVNIGIDPSDWKQDSSSQKIVTQVLSAVRGGKSNVVLLHDAGGNRAQTVQALPKIIEGLQAAGYQLGTVSALMNKTRDGVMPPTTPVERLIGRINLIGFKLADAAEYGIYTLFIISIGLGLLRLLGISTLAIRHRNNALNSAPISYLPSVAIIIPAFNEAAVILRTVEAALASKYLRCNVIVIDDGSTDGTFEILCKQYPNFRNLLFLRQKNAGKASALNAAIQRVDAEIVITIDADTLIHPDAVQYLVQHFYCPAVVAVAGNAKVGNRLNLLTRWQALEYVMGQNLDRRAFAQLNCICVVPGAIGAWRRQAVLEAGGFTEETLAEDTDLTLELLKRGGQITYEERALAFTEAPETITNFSKQRFRWVYGTIQAMWKHRHTLLRRQYRALGMVALPNMVIFQIFLPLLGPLMDFLMLESIIVTVLQRIQHPESYSNDSVRKIFIYYVLFLSLELLAGLIAFCLERKEDWKLLLWIPAQRFFYRQMLYYSVITSVLAAISGKAIGWNKFARHGTVTGSNG